MSRLVYRPIDESARPFVFATFAKSLGFNGDEAKLLTHALDHVLRLPEAQTSVVSPRGHAEEFFGWAVAIPSCLVYAYVRFDYRRSKLRAALGEEGRHLGSKLIDSVGGDEWAQVPAAIWTVDASQMAASGYPIRYDLEQNSKLKQLVR